MKRKRYQLFESSHSHVPVKAWVEGVPVENEAKKQLLEVVRLPFIYRWVAAMPDVHVGIGATVGSVIPTQAAIIPAAVGVDLGCGMMAVKTSLSASSLPDSLADLRSRIEASVPHGRTVSKKTGDKGSWKRVPSHVAQAWTTMKPSYEALCEKFPKLGQGNDVNQLGTLGSGNHFIELCLDEENFVWVMLHSGSRGVGNRIGTFFISLARKEMERLDIQLPNRDLAYLKEGTSHFDDYVMAVSWAQEFARRNREIMMEAVLNELAETSGLPPFRVEAQAINCHHNYVSRESHYGNLVWVTRKGAVSAREGELGIIPGSMGAESFIVRGKGNPESFHSCSHGAGRKMSRTEAKRVFSLEQHKAATLGIECRKDVDVIDETPGAYKDIRQVMEAQSDLVEIVHTLKQLVVVKG